MIVEVLQTSLIFSHRRKTANSGPVFANSAQKKRENGSSQTVWRRGWDSILLPIILAA